MIPDSLQTELCEWFALYPSIEKVILFGSRARGDFDHRSDIDLMVKATHISKEEWFDLVYRLKEETNTLLSIDLILWGEASKSLHDRVEKEGRVLYERNQDSAKLNQFGKGSQPIKGSLGRDTYKQPIYRWYNSTI